MSLLFSCMRRKSETFSVQQQLTLLTNIHIGERQTNEPTKSQYKQRICLMVTRTMMSTIESAWMRGAHTVRLYFCCVVCLLCSNIWKYIRRSALAEFGAVVCHNMFLLSFARRVIDTRLNYNFFVITFQSVSSFQAFPLCVSRACDDVFCGYLNCVKIRSIFRSDLLTTAFRAQIYRWI